MAINLCITYTEVVVVVGGWILYIGKCPRIVPFLENNGPRPLAGPRSIIFKEWSDTRTPIRTSDTNVYIGISSRIMKWSVFCLVHVLFCVTYWNISILDK